MNEDDGARPLVAARVDRGQVRGPAALPHQRIGHELDVLEVGEEREERVRRRRNEHAVAGIAEELEEPAIRLAGAGRERDRLEPHRGAALGVVAGHRGASVFVAEGRRLVPRAAGVAEELHQLGPAAEPRARRIRLGEVDEVSAALARGGDVARERVRREIPAGARREARLGHDGWARRRRLPPRARRLRGARRWIDPQRR